MPTIIYKCAKCKAIHGNFDKAEKCENSHLSAVSVKELEYRVGAYPFRVALNFPDGKAKVYTKND